jgi:hypothetical protein
MLGAKVSASNRTMMGKITSSATSSATSRGHCHQTKTEGVNAQETLNQLVSHSLLTQVQTDRRGMKPSTRCQTRTCSRTHHLEHVQDRKDILRPIKAALQFS